MESLNFNENFKEYVINGDISRKIRIKITPDIIEKFKNAAKKIDEIKAENDDFSSEKINEKACGIINDAFGSDICTPAFNGENIFSLVEGGKYLYEAFFEVFLPAFERDVDEFKKAFEVRPEVKKYLKKS